MTHYGFETGRKAVPWAGVLAIAAVLLFATGGQAVAKPTYLASFNSTYGTSGTPLDSCNLCHPGGNTSNFTPYATAFRNANHSFAAIEDADSDGDGFSNKEEIAAGTFPGDATSQPAAAPPPPPPAADTTRPTVTATSPGAGETGVPTNSAISVTFSEPMAAATITAATFAMTDGSGNAVAGTVSASGATATFAPSALLAGGATYTATVTTGAEDLAGNALAQASTWSFTTVPAASDADGDGVPDNLDAFPNDNQKATVPGPMGGQGTATIDTSANAGTRLMSADARADTDGSLNQAGKPAGYAFPNGVVSYVVAGISPGGTATVEISYPAPIPENSRVYKVDSAGFHEFPGAVINGNTVTLTLRDGGEGDADGQANGFIDDPVAVATPQAAAVSPSTGTPDSLGGGGCSTVGTGGPDAGAPGAYGLLAAIGIALLGRRVGRAGRRPLM
jgi:hypothetical protein